MRTDVFAVFAVFNLLPLSVSCATGRASAVPRAASPELRERYAGKTLECAGKLRENVIYAGIGAALASTTATSLSTYTATQATSLSSGVVLGLSCASCSLGATGLGLSIYSLLAGLDAANKDQMAGRVLADEDDDACVIGDLPEEPEPAPVAAPFPAAVPPT
jgi:hypothetical protein